jgi:prepilin-type N-terminal cleavage/methylation domain-containing protein
MARPRVIARLKRLWATYQKRRLAGFTLIELLVAMFIGGLITVSLLALVVQLVDVNQRDASRSETQRDMQAAMNYMTQELREAVFVYDGDCLKGSAAVTAANYTTECPGVVNHIPAGLSTASGGNTPTPILAFWRPDPLPQTLITVCNNQAKTGGDWSASTPAAVQNVPCLSGRTYTLVVYVLVDDTSTTDNWQGRGRIVRYQLPQFTSSAATGADTNTGYVDPLSAPSSTFQQWPFQLTTDANNVSTVSNAQTNAGGRPPGSDLDAVIGTGNAAVLVDYVDDGLLKIAGVTSTNPPVCLSNGKITPKSSTIWSFYACVRGNTYQAATAEQQVNQEVQVFLVGNVQGRPGFPQTTALPTGAIESQAFPMQTRVLTRGIINKSPK